MKRNEMIRIEETLSVLIGKPMRLLRRVGAGFAADFGELVDVDGIARRDESGQLVRDNEGKVIFESNVRGKYALDALCSVRFTCGDEVIFAKSDMFLPIEAIARQPDFVWDTFDWHVRGNNAFDEIVAKHFRGEFDEYVVKSVKVNKFGDFTITFENGFMLEFFADGSGLSENWRFGEINSTASLIVTSKGILDELT